MSEEMEKHLRANMNLSKKQVMLVNFLGGFSWGVGSVIGATLIVALGGIILNSLGVFDPVKTFFEQLQALPQLPNLVNNP